jgi:hypothetical protein
MEEIGVRAILTGYVIDIRSSRGSTCFCKGIDLPISPFPGLTIKTRVGDAVMSFKIEEIHYSTESGNVYLGFEGIYEIGDPEAALETISRFRNDPGWLDEEQSLFRRHP